MISRTAVLIKNNFPLKFINIKIGELKKNQVLVKIIYSGFCSSQYGEIIGIKGKDRYIPHCLGHEACGVVVKASNNVKHLKKNDIVVCHWMKNNSPDCEKIEYKDQNNRIINSGQITTFSKYSVISSNRLTKVSKYYNPKYLPLMGCSIPVSISTLEKILKVKKNKNILILGAGALGLPAIHFCKIKKLKTIDVVDINPKNLILSKKFGATDSFLNIDEKKIKDKLKRNKYDYIFDTIAVSKITNKILSYNINSKIVFLGVPKKKEKIKLNSLKINYGLKLLGSYGGNYKPAKDLKRFLDFLIKTNFDFEKYICKIYKFNNINKLVNDYKNGKIVGKALIKIS